MYTTRTDGNATVCAQCLDWIQRPMMKNWCPECGAPAHTECMNEHCIQTHGKPFDQVKRNVVASDELSRGCPANCPGTRTFRVPPQGLLHYPGSTSSWKNLVSCPLDKGNTMKGKGKGKCEGKGAPNKGLSRIELAFASPLGFAFAGGGEEDRSRRGGGQEQESRKYLMFRKRRRCGSLDTRIIQMSARWRARR